MSKVWFAPGWCISEWLPLDGCFECKRCTFSSLLSRLLRTTGRRQVATCVTQPLLLPRFHKVFPFFLGCLRRTICFKPEMLANARVLVTATRSWSISARKFKINTAASALEFINIRVKALEILKTVFCAQHCSSVWTTRSRRRMKWFVFDAKRLTSAWWSCC